MVKYQSWWRSPPTARKPSETDAKSCGADAALREMALVDLPSGPVETWSKWLRKGSKVTPSMGIDVLDRWVSTCLMAQRLRLHPPLPLTAGTLARRRLVSILHPRRLCAAGSSRSSTPDALAPQARLDPPPRTALRRRLVSILPPGRPCAAG